ncbi:hypothetical protein [Streptomyces sp. NPDC059928]|uniref:hypothetical protein n=1 Tax=unclassified Streptomyces TaxID=2593676 RepID=UPI00366682B3
MGGIRGGFSTGNGGTAWSASSREGTGFFFPLMRSWAAGIVVLYGSGFLLGFAYDAFANAERLGSFGWRLALIYLPNVLGTVLAVWIAARILPEPHRDSSVLYLVAALAMPVLAAARALLVAWDFLTVEGLSMMAAAAVLGSIAGLALDHLLGARRGAPGAVHGWGDSGASATEYMGTIVVVAAVVTALSGTSLGQAVSNRIRAEICKVTGGSCATTSTAAGPDQGLTDAQFEPALCNTHNESSTAGNEVKLGWFKIGNEYGFQKQDYSTKDKDKDGNPVRKYRITFSEAGKLGASWKPKFGMEAGEFEKQPAEVEVEGGLKFTSGDTFEFDTAKKRDDFLKKLDERAGAKAAMQYGRDYTSVRAADRFLKLDKEINDTVKGQKISYGTIGAEGTANASLQLSKEDSDVLSAKLGGKVKASPSVTLTHDTIHDVEGMTYTFELEGGNSLDMSGGGTGVKGDLSGKRTASVTVNRDPKDHNKLKSIVITHTSQEKGSGKLSGDKSKEGSTADPESGKKPKGKVAGSTSADATQTETVTNTIRFQDSDDSAKQSVTDHDRATAESWLSGDKDKTSPFTTLFSDTAPTSEPKNGTDFDKMMFARGQSSRTAYTGVSNAAELGFEINLASVGFGYKAQFSKDTQQLGDAEFLGAPRDGKRGYLPYSYCAN